MSTVRSATHLAKRVRQTPTLFRNFPTVFWDLGTARTPWRRAEMTFKMRNGYVVTCPNSNGARFPLFEIFGDDAYDMEALVAGVSSDATVLDVGGQIGSFALAVARAPPAAYVQVYEASPTSADYIARNVEGNGLASRVTVHAKAMAGETGEFTFLDSGTASGHNGLTAPEWMRTDGAREVTVEAETFDNAVALAPTPVEIVKMDIEGAEYDLVLRSSPESWSTVRKIVMEYHPVAGHDLQELLDFFAPLGLTPARQDPGTEPGLGVIWLTRQ
ncbi:FkbM family methyltransferase [Nocardioides albidus]|uniref:FkbM family methyltransferase n=1 Tax=Nocardioides albidus TaxID=1517589 RepID=A0A5C4W9V0_9ACTN|nr:FkbM family methyltransferase [Nocardioides albidus]TNM44119.1 FkbM family methyltransferase [Nocardioides albidus]